MKKLGDYILLNPKENISKGKIARKIAMENLKPFTRDINTWSNISFNGGSKFRNGDTLLARITPCLENGKTAFVNILGDDEIAYGSTEFYVLRAVKNKMDPYYLYYLTISKKFRNTMIKAMTGTSGRQRVPKEAVLEYLMDVPDFEGQKKIGEKLKVIDDKITLNNQINDNLFALSKVIFDHILGNKTIKFSQISTIQNGYAFKSKEYITDKQLMILRTKNINDNHLFSKNDVIYISNNLFSNYKKFLFNTFDTVLVMVGASIGKTGFITSNMMPALQNQNMWRFRPLISGMPGLLVYQYVNYINEHVKGSATGSARSFYRKKVFNAFNVPYIEHKNYAIFIALQKEINRINVENDILRNIKKSLLNYFF